MKPNFKPRQVDSVFDEPKLFKVVDGKKFPLPALETAFVDFTQIEDGSIEDLSGCICNSVGTTVCACNKVKQVCTCVGYVRSSCSCDSHSSGGGRVTGCRCAPVH